jgi:hypothetical protein
MSNLTAKAGDRARIDPWPSRNLQLCEYTTIVFKIDFLQFDDIFSTIWKCVIRKLLNHAFATQFFGQFDSNNGFT